MGSLIFLGIAAVILFSLFLRASSWTADAFASLGANKEEQLLITEEFLKAQFQETENRVVREGSYVYTSGYYPSGQSSDTDDGFGGEELSGNILIQGVAFLSPNSPSPNLIDGIGIFGKERSDVVTYEVQAGDTPSYIAASFGISTNTLLWTNNLSYYSIIKPGDKLTILPTSGVLHEVKKGETLDAIVKKYKGDLTETLAFNGLPADASVQVGQKILIPNGIKVIPVPSQPQVAYRSVSPAVYGSYGDKSHKFPWGQCTWYIAQLRYIPWGGHAKNWLSNAQKYGFPTGKEPRVGAIVATNETWYGHVAYVEAVNGDFITVSEMSLGRGIKKLRNIPISSKKIKGYIY